MQKSILISIVLTILTLMLTMCAEDVSPSEKLSEQQRQGRIAAANQRIREYCR